MRLEISLFLLGTQTSEVLPDTWTCAPIKAACFLEGDSHSQTHRTAAIYTLLAEGVH